MSERRSPRCLDERDLGHLVALASLPGLTPKRLWSLLDLGDPVEAWRRVAEGELPSAGRTGDPAPGWPAHAAAIEPASMLARHREAGIDVLVHGETDYPQRLLDDPEPPAVLFVAGRGSPLDRAAVAVVGTRRCTRYGREVALELGTALASRGIDVVSGLARGVDAAAHAGARRSAIECCVGVVAGGLDLVYPRSNRELWHAIADGGRLISEWPLGSPSVPWRFPARNRLVAALSVAVVVVESSERGGSMYTVDEAVARDRPVFGVPGSIRSPASHGTNRLIVDGAVPLTSIPVFVDTLAPAVLPASRAAVVAEPDHPESWLLALLGWEPMTVEAVVTESGRSPSDTLLEVERQIRDGRVQRSGVRLERIR